MKNITILSMVLIFVAAAGCSSTGTVINAYNGPERDDREVAILFTPKDESNSGERSGALLSNLVRTMTLAHGNPSAYGYGDALIRVSARSRYLLDRNSLCAI